MDIYFKNFYYPPPLSQRAQIESMDAATMGVDLEPRYKVLSCEDPPARKVRG